MLIYTYRSVLVTVNPKGIVTLAHLSTHFHVESGLAGARCMKWHVAVLVTTLDWRSAPLPTEIAK